MDLLLLVAVLPAAWLLHYFYKLDPVEKEPVRLLARLLVWGAVACFPAVLLEELGINVLMGGAPGSDIGSLLFENFIVIALSEELCKMFFLRWKTWKSPEFNYVFDGIVYAVFVSLGFAILENIGYVMMYGMSTALLRTLTALPCLKCAASPATSASGLMLPNPTTFTAMSGAKKCSSRKKSAAGKPSCPVTEHVPSASK